jgi:hypothetical protein
MSRQQADETRELSAARGSFAADHWVSRSYGEAVGSLLAATPSAELLPTWVSAVAGAAGVVVAVIAIVLTYTQVRLTGRQLRESSVREAQDSEARTRPYLSIDIVPGLAGRPTFDIVIANLGATTATDVRLRLTHHDFDKQSEDDQIGPALGELLAAGFDLAPSARRRLLWRIPGDTNTEPPGDIGAPISDTVRATYMWDPADGRPSRHYEDRLQYDLSQYPFLTPAASRGSTTQGSPTDQNVHLKNLIHALRAIADHVGELRR